MVPDTSLNRKHFPQGKTKNKVMKKTWTLFVLLIFSTHLFSQQEAQYTNFMYNQQVYNPAYVGSRNTPSFTGIHRSQWLGFEGAPNSQVLSFQTPIMRQSAGIGGTVSRNQIGVTTTQFVSAAYSYRIRITQDIDLRLGMHASLHYRGFEFSDPKVVTVSQNDPSLSDGEFNSRYNANLGIGMYATYKEMFYFGASSPGILPSNFSFNDFVDNPAELSPHTYVTFGAIVPIEGDLEVMPNVLIKSVQHAPVDVDLNISLRYMKKVTGGLTARIGGNSGGIVESIDALLFFQFQQKIGAGLAYDLTTSRMRDFQSGSIELILRYDLRDERSNLENPRYFNKNKN